jgi:hypothetical protein
MVMHTDPAVDRELVRHSATTKWECSLFSPSIAAICYCGKVVGGRVLCAECSERMSHALQRSLVDRLGRESAGLGEESSRSDSGPISGYEERRAH